MATGDWKRWALPGAIALALVPFVASAIALIVRVGDDYIASADQAWIELQVRDIGHRPVLLGPYSRFGWFHPGPILYYLLWLPYRITGSTSLSLCFAALTLNAVALVGIALVAKRRGGLPLVLLTLFLSGLLISSLGDQFLRDVWNPSITILPFVLVVLLAWSISCGEAWALPVGAGVATFLVQTHVSYGFVTAAVLAAGLVGAAITMWRRRVDAHHRDRVRSWLRMISVTVGLLVVVWLPVVIQQVTASPGNLGTLVRFFRDHDREYSYGDAWHVVASQLSAWPDWVRGTIVTGVSGPTPIAVAAVLLIGAAVLTWRCAKDGFRFDVIVGLAIVAGVVSVSRIVGDILQYLVIWTWALGMLTWVAIGWSVARWWQTRTTRDPRVGRVALAVVAAALVAVTVVNTVDAARAGNPDPIGSRSVRGLTAIVRDQLPERDGVVEIRVINSAESPWIGAFSAWIGAGIAVELEHEGIDTRVAPELESFYGPDRVLDGERVRLTVLPVEDSGLPAARQLPCFDEVGRVGGYTLFVENPACASGS